MVNETLGETKDENMNGTDIESTTTDTAIDADTETDNDTETKENKTVDTVLQIPTPMIGGVPLPTTSLDTKTMVRRMQSMTPTEKTPYDALAESTDDERNGMGYTDDVMLACGAIRVNGKYPTRSEHDRILGKALPPMLAKFSRKMIIEMVACLALGIVWACLNGISWLLGGLLGIGLFILAAIGEMIGLMREVRTTDGLDYCAVYESNVKAFDWEKAEKMATGENVDDDKTKDDSADDTSDCGNDSDEN